MHTNQQLMLINGSQNFSVYVFQPPFVFVFCMHLFYVKGLDGTCGKDTKRHYVV
jgi:hypothetical protein